MPYLFARLDLLAYNSAYKTASYSAFTVLKRHIQMIIEQVMSYILRKITTQCLKD